MLQEVCEHIHNYFSVDRLTEHYTITDGTLSPAPALKDGQRFLIEGSVLNDGMYTWHSDGTIKNDDDGAGAGLVDEAFTGTVCGLAVPPKLISLTAEISDWVAAYGAAINSPYQSESFGGYSYTKAAGANGTSVATGWEDHFRRKLDRWRRVCF